MTGYGRRLIGGVRVGFWGLDKRFTAATKDLTGVIGRFEASGPVLRRGVLRSPLVGCSWEFVSVASGLLLEEGGYPLGIRRFQKNLRHVLGVRVPYGSDPPDRPIQVIVAAPKRDAAGPE